MIKNFLLKKYISAISIFAVLLNLMLPLFIGQQVYAQEVTPVPTEIREISTPAPEPSVSPVTESPAPEVAASPVPEVSPESSPLPEPTPSVNPVTVAPELAPSVTPSPTPVPDLTLSPEVTPSAIPSPESSPTLGPTPVPSVLPVRGSLEGGGYETNETVVINEDYIYPENDKLRIKFTQISDPAGKLKIKQVTLSPEQIEQLGALSETAYEITSTMADGTFFYDLTLPIPPEAQNKEVDVKSSETVEEAGNAQKVSEPEEKTADTITIHGLNHFTVFILTTPAPDNTQSILINEVLPNPSVGLEWVELYNNTTGAIDLAAGIGWTIDSATGVSQSLSALGSIPAGGLAVFEAPAGWLSNTAPETVTVSNEIGTAIDTVTISLTSPGFAVNRYPAAGESVGRSSDGNSQWILFTSPTKGTTNVLTAPANKAVATTIEANGYPTWYGDDNGTRVAACLDGSDPRCAMAGEVGFDPANPTVFPNNFPSEFFYWSAEALLGGSRLVMAAEGAFLNDAVAEGDQMVFGRLRIDLGDLSPNSTYTVTHPYGVEIIQTDESGGGRNDNPDIGCGAAPCDFAAALASPVFESFLRWDTGAPAGFLGDGITEHAVTGSPTGNNFFKIEGPGLPAGGIQTGSFIVLGKLFVDPVTPPPGCIDIAPDVPVLAGPADGATEVATSPTLTWNSIASFGTNCLGNNNQFEIFLDAGNVDPTTSWGNVSEATLSKFILGLTGNTAYSWKVRAKNGALFTDSAVRTFTTTVVAVGSRAVSASFRTDGYPTWYRDDNGIMVQACLDGADPLCAAALPPFGEEPQWDPNQPTVFPTNFPSEFFYWTAESSIEAAGVSALLILADEGAFLNENPAPGDQMVFGRIRVRGDGFLPNTEYIITHPYGQDVHTTNEFGALRPSPNTEDIGCTASLCNFALALNSRIFGGFLRQPAAPDGYLGDGISFLPVIGSPLNQNFFRIEGPGLPAGGLQSNLFAVTGKVFVPTPPPPGCIDTAPDQPTLVSPVDAATEVSTNPLLSWNVIASFGTNCVGGRDQFEIFLDAGNVDPTTSGGTVLGTQISFTALNLLPNTTYSWKVRASNNALFTDSVVRTFTTTASTANKAVSPPPNDPNGFPNWYRDDLGAAVVPCLDGTDPICVLPATGEEPGFDPTQPTVLPGNFPSEFFYWIAESNPLATPGGGDVDIRYAVEGAFLGGSPVPGDQMVFGRIRMRATGLEPNSTYTATHAYGVDLYNTDENGNITSVLGTEDIGCFAGPCNFVETLSSRVFGGFLRMVTGAPVGYLGDGATFSEVTGSPLGQNFFRIEGPGLPAGGLITNLFTVSGKLFVPVGGPDVTAPVITVLGANPVDAAVGTAYVDAGATALDNVDGDLTASIVTVNPVNTNVIGTYTVTYNVSDAASNPAVEAARTVNVVAVPPPVDIIAPNLLSFSSTTVDGTYGPGASINVTANFNEPLAAGSTAIVTLDNTVPIELVSLSLVSTNTLSGTYVVGPLGSGEDSPDLTVASITSMNVTDVAGNLQTSTALPLSNIADTSDIVINTTTPPPPPGPTTGSITVVKDAVPNDIQDFGFRMRNGPFDESFTLDDDGNNANELSNTVTFADLAAGSYDLQETSLGSFVLNNIVCLDLDGETTINLNSRTATIDLDAGEAITCTFTNTQQNSISGMKFRDLNGNGIKETGEAGLVGWTIFLDENDNAVLDGGEPSVVTDAAGNYQFIDVAGGTQNVREVLQAGWTQTAPAGGKYTLVLANNSFINQDFGNTPVLEILGGSFTFSGESDDAALTATALEDITINVPTGNGISTIIIPAGTVISKSDGSPFDMALLGASEALAGSLTGMSSGTVVDGALQWGIPNTGLTFSQPITVGIFVGNEFNGQTLNILRSVSGTSGWTGDDGIVAPGTCAVLAGLCMFQATKASFYVASHTESIPTPPTPAPAPASGGSSSGGGGGDGLSDGLGCASHDCSIHPAASLQGQASADSANDFTAEVLGAQAGEDNFGTGTGGPIIEESPSPSSEVLGIGDGNVGIGGINQAGVTNQSFLGFVQTQRSLLGILVGLIVLFGSNILFRRKVSQK